MEGVILLNAYDDFLVMKVFPQHDLQVSTPAGFVLSLWVVFEHFLSKMYNTVTDVVGEKRINFAYPREKDQLSLSNLELRLEQGGRRC